MPTLELLRVPFSADVDDFVATRLAAAARSVPALDACPVVYLTHTDRRGRMIARRAGEHFPRGTPEYVARKLLHRFEPAWLPISDVERDFAFFAALADALQATGENRRAGRPMVDELLVAHRRLSQALPPSQRTPQALAAWTGELGPRGRLLHEVITRYNAQLGERIEPEDASWLVAERMAGWDFAPALVIVDDLDRVTPGRRALLQALCAKAARVLFVLRGIRESNQPGSMLEFVADAHIQQQEIVLQGGGSVLPEREWPTRAGSGLADAWLAGAPVSDPRLSLLRPQNRESEVREAARAIKRAAAQGVALREIGVAMPAMGKYRELIDEQFTNSGIPFDAPFEVPLDQVTPVAATIDFLRCAVGGLERLELLDALASPFARFDVADEAARLARLEALGNETREAYIVGGRDPQRDWLGRLPPESQSAVFLATLLPLLTPLCARRAGAAEYVAHVISLHEAMQVRAVCRADTGPGAAMRAEAEHEWRNLLAQMQAEFTRAGNPLLPVGDVLRALVEQARTRAVRAPELADDRVQVLGLRELRGSSFRRLIVLGLADTDLPLGAEESMFLPESRLDALAAKLGRAVASELCRPVDTAHQAGYLYAHTLLAAGESLTLSLPTAERDTPFVPAAVHARLLRCAGITALDQLIGTRPDAPATSPDDYAVQVARALCDLELRDARPAARLPLGGVARKGLRGRVIELARGDMAAAATEYEGATGELPALAARFALEGDDRRAFSPSQLDTYAACPMRFWSRYVLGVKVTEEPTLDTRPNAVGTFLHEVFERFVLLLRRHAGQPDVLPDPVSRKPVSLAAIGGKGARELGLRLMGEAFRQASQSGYTEGPFWDGVKRLVAAGLPGEPDLGLGQGLLARFVDFELARNEAGFGVRFVEFSFGMGKQPTPQAPDVVPDMLELPVPGGTIPLMGSVDRVDEGPDGLCILDYKTGGARTAAEIRDGKAFQLPAYLAAISDVAESAPSGMGYVSVPASGSPELVDVTQSRRKPAFDVHELVTKHLPRRLGAMIGAMRGGLYPHLPFKQSKWPCNYCEFAQTCARRDEVIDERMRRNEAGHGQPGLYLPDAPPGKTDNGGEA